MGRHSIPGPDDFADEPLDDGGADTGEQDYRPGTGRFAARSLDDRQFEDGDDADPARYLRRGGYYESGQESSNEPDYESEYGYDPEPGFEYFDADEPDDYPEAGDYSDEESPLTDRGDWRSGYRGGWRGGHRSEVGRRGVSVGVITALVSVIVLVGAVILWRFFGHSLSNRSDVAAGRCLNGDLTVAVVADPSIADHLQGFADRFNKSAKPVADRCVSVQVKPANSDAVVSGFIGAWPAQLGQRPALWVPGSSISAARLKAAAGPETISDSRSLVTSPVLLAVHPKLGSALAKQNWASLPELQSQPDTLAGLGLTNWGSLRLALPIDGNSDAAFLAGEAVAAAAAPHGAPPTDGVDALRTLVNGQPKLADNSLAEALNVLLRSDDPATSPVHAVITTEQQVFTRGESLSGDTDTLGSWLAPGPVPVADYPTVLLSGSWLSPEQVSAASEFARFAHKADQLVDLAKAGFRVEGVKPPSSSVTDFAALPSTLAVGDDALRATLANTLSTPAGSSAVTIMLDVSMNTDEGGKSRLAHVVAGLDQRIRMLPGSSAVGLWRFDGVEGRSVVSLGALDEQVSGQPRTVALTSELDELNSTPGGAVSFTTLRMVYNQALANYRDGQSNSILVITAGPHTDQTLDGPGLQDFIKQTADPQHPIAVNVIDFGAGPDRATWQSVAQLSGGSYQHLTGAKAPDFTTALATLLS